MDQHKEPAAALQALLRSVQEAADNLNPVQ